MERVIEKYINDIYRCAFFICKNHSDAEDITQEVLYKYMTKAPIFKDEIHEKNWLLRVAVNMSKNYVRSFWQSNTEGIKNDIQGITENEVEIWEIVQELPEKYRIVILLYYFEGYSIKEISSILDKKCNTVGTWLERAKKMLKKRMEDSNGKGTIRKFEKNSSRL